MKFSTNYRNRFSTTSTNTPHSNITSSDSPTKTFNNVNDGEVEEEGDIKTRDFRYKCCLITIVTILCCILIFLVITDSHSFYFPSFFSSSSSLNNNNNNINNLVIEIENIDYINSARKRNIIPSIELRKMVKNTKDDVHIVFSTGCSENQNWQSEVLLYSWAYLNHPGQITRLVSGCKNKEEKLLALNTAIVSERVHYFFAPDYTPPNHDGHNPFHYFNKPYSMQKWLHEIDIAESFIILIDPDMIITKVFDYKILGIEKGKPVSQKYGIGAKWYDWNICQEEGCKISQNEMWKHYSVGPPYMMHIDDWKLIIDKWVDYSPPALEKDPPPSILAEMYSYAMACAHYNLKHEYLTSMLSNLESSISEEPWPQINWNFLTYSQHSFIDPGVHILHYCHGYWLGNDRNSGHLLNAGFNFHKGHLPKDILHNCEIGLLIEPPTNDIGFKRDQDKQHRNVWMLYQVITRINAALANYKYLYCDNWIARYDVVLIQPEFDRKHRMYYYLDQEIDELNNNKNNRK